jgi:ribosome recycling factor
VPRNVGSIEVTVDANTQRLKATLVKDSKKIGEASAKQISAELRGIEASIGKIDGTKEARLLRAQLEAALRNIPAYVELDAVDARADLKKFEEQAELIDLMLDVNARIPPEALAVVGKDWQKAKRIIEADHLRAEVDLIFAEADMLRAEEKAQRELDTMEFEAEVEMIFRQARIDRAAFDRQQMLNKVGLETEMDFARAEAQILGFVASHQDETLRAQMETELNRAKVAFDLAALNAMVENYDFDANVKVRYDKAQKARDVDDPIKANLAKTGQEAGRGFGGSLLSGDNTKLILAAALTMGDILASGLAGGIAAATSVISSGVTAIGAAAAAAAPAFAALGQGITAIIVGSQGVGTAMSAVTKEFEDSAAAGIEMNLHTVEVVEALSKLSPAARRTVEAFGDMRGELADLRLDVQEQLFQGLGSVLDDLGTTALPSISEGLQIAAQSANAFGREVGGIATETDFAGIFKGLDPALDDLFDGVVAIVRALEPFLKTSAPAAERLAEMFERGAEALNDWVRTNPVKLTRFLDDGLTSLERWLELLGSTGDLLVTLFDAGAESGDDFVISLNNMIERWDAFLESVEGQDALEKFFRRGREIMDDFKPVLDGLREAFDILITDAATANFESLAEAIAEALPALAELIRMVGEMQLAEAALEILAAFGPLFEIIADLPDGVLELVGSFVILSKTLLSVRAAMIAAGVAAKTMEQSSVALLAASAAIAAGLALWDAFTSNSREAEEAQRDFTRAVEDSIDALITSGQVAAGDPLGLDAINKAIVGVDEEADKFTAAMSRLNKSTDDSRETLRAIQTDGVAGLTELAESAKLPADAAKRLAEIVNRTNDNFKEGDTVLSAYGDDIREIAEAAGLSEGAIVAIAGAMEQVQDRAEENNIEELANSILEAAAAGDAETQSLLNQAVATALLEGYADDVVAVMDEFIRRQNDAANASDDAGEAGGNQAATYAILNDAIADGLAATQERNAALQAERNKAYDAAVEEGRLAEKTRDVAAASADAFGWSEDVAGAFIELGDAAGGAAANADALKASIDLLLAPALDAEAAFDAVQQSIADLDLAMKGGQEAIDLRKEAVEKLAEAEEKRGEAAGEEDPERAAQIRADADALVAEAAAANESAAAMEARSQSLDGLSEESRATREALRGEITDIQAWAVAELARGTAADEVAGKVEFARQGLINQASALFATREEAQAYVDALGLTPAILTTLIETPGLADALLNADNLTLLYDDLGNPVISEFEALGIDQALAKSGEFKALVEGLAQLDASPTISAETAAPTEEEIRAVEEAAVVLGTTTAAPTIEVPPTAETLQTQLDDLQLGIDTLDTSTASVGVTIPGIQTRLTEVLNLGEALSELRDKTITVTVNTRRTGMPMTEFERAGGAMAGEMIRFPTVRRVGERGYREAIVPLDLPLNRVNPEVRALAEMLRGGQHRQVGAGKTVNNYMTITPRAADPSAVAQQVINRAAALAAR